MSEAYHIALELRNLGSNCLQCFQWRKISERLWLNYKLLHGFPNSCEYWERAVLFKRCLSRAQIHSSSLLYLELETLKQRPPTSSKTLLLKLINLHLELVIPLIKKLQYFR